MLFGRSWYDLIIDLLIHHSVGQRIHMTLVFPNHVRRVPNKMESLVWNMKLSSHISSVNYFTSAGKENRCNEQLIIQNNHPLKLIPSLNIFRGRSAMVRFTHSVNRIHWPVFCAGPHQPALRVRAAAHSQPMPPHCTTARPKATLVRSAVP